MITLEEVAEIVALYERCVDLPQIVLAINNPKTQAKIQRNTEAAKNARQKELNVPERVGA